MRGEVWTVAGSGYASKPRPAVVVQSDDVDTFDSTIVCLFTTDQSISGPMRVPLEPDGANGLAKPCSVMVEKVIAVRKAALGRKIGELSKSDMERISDALRMAMGL